MRVGRALRRELVVVDVDAAHIAGELVDALELLERERAQPGRHLDVLTEHDDVHAAAKYTHASAQPAVRAAGVRVAVAAATDRRARRRAARERPRRAWRRWSRRRRRRGPVSPPTGAIRARDRDRAARSARRRPSAADPASRWSSDRDRQVQLARDDAREQLAVVDAVRAPARATRGDPRDDVDRARARGSALRDRGAQPRERRARVAVLRARDELARDAFVRERRDPPVDARRRRRVRRRRRSAARARARSTARRARRTGTRRGTPRPARRRAARATAMARNATAGLRQLRRGTRHRRLPARRTWLGSERPNGGRATPTSVTIPLTRRAASRRTPGCAPRIPAGATQRASRPSAPPRRRAPRSRCRRRSRCARSIVDAGAAT